MANSHLALELFGQPKAPFYQTQCLTIVASQYNHVDQNNLEHVMMMSHHPIGCACDHASNHASPPCSAFRGVRYWFFRNQWLYSIIHKASALCTDVQEVYAGIEMDWVAGCCSSGWIPIGKSRHQQLSQANKIPATANSDRTHANHCTVAQYDKYQRYWSIMWGWSMWAYCNVYQST